MGLSKIADEDGHLALPSDEGPVHGPLWRAVRTSGLDHGTDYGNILLILFAGHDTTGHTMTWLTFELARNPKIQAEVRREVLAFFASLRCRSDVSRLESLGFAGPLHHGDIADVASRPEWHVPTVAVRRHS